MLVFGTQMHVVTFLFICIEVVILCYLFIYRLARPDDKTTYLNICLISLLLLYNLTGGLLPDTKLPGSYFIQISIAYFTGFITPCYFPYYVYKAFNLHKIRFHAYRGVFICLIIPYIAFVALFALTGEVEEAKNILVIPTAYALWVIYSLNRAINFKYNNQFNTAESRQEKFVLLISLTPWIGLPIIDYLSLGQAIEASITNIGFLSLFAYQVKRHITEIRLEHLRVVESEQRLMNWNSTLQSEVEKRTKELEKINEQQMHTFINLAHETKTPLTLVNNYMDDYIAKNGPSDELSVVKSSLDKLSADIVNLFDLEKFKKGFAVYNHDQVCDFSKILNDSIALFTPFAVKNKITIEANTDEEIYLKADPLSINRIINNLIENAIKFSPEGGKLSIDARKVGEKVLLSVKDEGPGIPLRMQSKVFEPYYQIANQKKNTQGMGLGLPIVKKVVEDLNGTIKIESNPEIEMGTEIIVELPNYPLTGNERVSHIKVQNPYMETSDLADLENLVLDKRRKTIMLVEDNKALLHYLINKLKEKYNVYPSLNGNEALKKLNSFTLFPDLIISDVMMDKLDGFSLASVLAKHESFQHIPFIFLTAKSTPSDRLKGLKLGAVDFIQKPFNMVELLQKIDSLMLISDRQRRALIDTIYIRRDETQTLNTDLKKIFELNCNKYQLTPREKDIAELVCQGQKNKTIGETLFISEKTVAKHIQNIFEKVGVSNKLELMNKLESVETVNTNK